MPKQTIYRFLRAAGVRDMVVDGSSTPVDYGYTPGTGKSLKVERINFRMRGLTLRLNRFGPIATLTNGLRFLQLDPLGTVLRDFMDGETVKDLDEFSLLAGIDNLITADAGDDTWAARWTLSKAGGPFMLPELNSFVIRVQDALAGITFFDAMVQGVLEY